MKRTITKLMLASVALVVGIAFMPPDAAAKKPAPDPVVNCDAGDSLQVALDNAKLREPFSIYVSGNCTDGPFHIHQDVRVIGSPVATLSAPAGGHNVVSIVDGSSAELTDLAVDASDQVVGIQVAFNSTAVMRNVMVAGASEPAINVADGSYAWVANSELYGNGTGLQVTQAASAAMNDSSVHDNDFGVATMVFSNVSLDGNTIVNNTLIGVVAASGGTYGNVTLRGTPNTIESNGTDVYCDVGGLLSADQLQSSTTGSIGIDPDCRVFGEIF